MRAVILLNPHGPVEHMIKGREYADASIGFNYLGDIKDQSALAKTLRELADILEAPDLTNSDISIL